MTKTQARKITLIGLLIFSGLPVRAQSVPPDAKAGTPAFDRAKVEVMVLGTYHLRQINPDNPVVATNMIARSMLKYKPDHIVVEWLHPAIDPATTFNYKPLGDMETLARLWGYESAKVGESLDRVKAVLGQDANTRNFPSQAIAELRVELAKLYYLSKDQLNAGYQCWLAARMGADVRDLKRLTLDYFRGHEIEIYGFEIARNRGLEYITPFDYQGAEAGSDVWGEILERLREMSIQKKHGVAKTDARWQPLADAFDKDRKAFEESRSKAWEENYGDIKEVREYAAVFRGFDESEQLMPKTRDGLSQMRWLQSPGYLALERKMHLELVPGISIDGLGKIRTAGNLRRNELMVDFAEADIKRLGTKRVLIIVGYSHKFFLEDLLKARGYRVVPSTEFMP